MGKQVGKLKIGSVLNIKLGDGRVTKGRVRRVGELHGVHHMLTLDIVDTPFEVAYLAVHTEELSA